MEEIKPITNCRACGSEDLTKIISFGRQYISNFVKSKEEQGVKIPLNLVLCENCKLLQLEHNVPPELMWNEQYWYQSGISSTIKNDLKDIVEKSEKLLELKDKDIVIDIGANDGTMLEYYKNENLNLLGFEPCSNVAEKAKEKGFQIIDNFFNSENYKERWGDKKARLITAISMFYDLEDPNKFLEDIKGCLDEDGLFIIQQNYLMSMLEQNAFDNIVHEHREFYSFTSLENLLEKHGFEIFDIELNDINGGSLRTYVKFKGCQLKGFEGAEERIEQIKESEKKFMLNTRKPYMEFASRIEETKKELRRFLRKEKDKGKKIWVYGASTRGNTALQYFELGPDLIDYIADMNPDKHGKRTIGSLIPIASPEEMRKANPDYLMVNTWHFFDEIREQEKEWADKGGKFIVALPNFKVI